MKRRHEVCETVTAYYDLYRVHHEYDAGGNHRLQIEGCVGDWTIYGGIAKLEYKGTTFAATTEYFFPLMPELFVIHPLLKHSTEEPKKLTMRERAELKAAKALEGQQSG